jgi:hypothetical protein
MLDQIKTLKIMKKTYIQPNAELHVVALEQNLMSGSETTMNVMNEVYDEGSMTDLSRESHSIWDED